ncbi:MAG: hypothetical protein R3Y36_00680 [Spirochaetales bacterium]
MEEKTKKLNTKADYLHREILHYLLEKKTVEDRANELFEIVKGENLFFKPDHLLLFQVYSLLGDTDRVKEIEKIVKNNLDKVYTDFKNMTVDEYIERSNWKMLPESDLREIEQLNTKERYNRFNFHLHSEIKKFERLRSLSIQDINNEHLKQFGLTHKSQLNDFLTKTKEEIDNQIDEQIMWLVLHHFRHLRNPRGLFHTDLPYTMDFIRNDNDGCIDSKYIVSSTRLLYQLRYTYSKSEYTEKEKELYDFQYSLFERILFNKIMLLGIDTNGKQPHYYEPEDFLKNSLELLKTHKTFKKSVFATLYFASKEIFESNFKELFLLTSDKEKKYQRACLNSFQNMMNNSLFYDDYAKDILKGRNYDKEKQVIKSVQFEKNFSEDHIKPVSNCIEQKQDRLSAEQKSFVARSLFYVYVGKIKL